MSKSSKKRKPPIAIPALDSRLLRVEQAAQYLACTIWQIRSLVWDHQLPAIKLGRRLLIDRADLDKFVERKKEDRAA